MDIIVRVLREYNLLTAAFTAFFAMALVLEWISLTDVQIGAVLGFLAAIMAVIRFAVTPTSSPVLPVGTLVNENSSLPTSRVVALTEEE